MTDTYKMIDELHAIVTSPEFSRCGIQTRRKSSRDYSPDISLMVMAQR